MATPKGSTPAPTNSSSSRLQKTLATKKLTDHPGWNYAKGPGPKAQ